MQIVDRGRNCAANVTAQIVRKFAKLRKQPVTKIVRWQSGQDLFSDY